MKYRNNRLPLNTRSIGITCERIKANGTNAFLFFSIRRLYVRIFAVHVLYLFMSSLFITVVVIRKAGSNYYVETSDSRDNILSPGAENVANEIDQSKHYNLCAIGAGLTGTVFVERTANHLSHKVLLLDARSHIGGNVYDFINLQRGYAETSMARFSFTPIVIESGGMSTATPAQVNGDDGIRPWLGM